MQNHRGRGKVNKRRVSLERGGKTARQRHLAKSTRLVLLDFREIRGFLRIILPPRHAAPWKKKRKKRDGTSWKSAATFRLRKCKSRNATDYAHGPLENSARGGGGGKGKEKKRKGGEEKRRKRKRKQKRWFASGPWLDRVHRGTQGALRGGRGKLNVRKKVANVVKIRDRQSGALCPAGEQYRRRSGDWRIFLRIGRHCWIFQIVFLACAAAEIARNPFGHCHLSISHSICPQIYRRLNLSKLRGREVVCEQLSWKN